MAGTKEIKRRIKSVKNTKKITKAMELVAASKMKRAVASTLASRPYAEYSWEVLESLRRGLEELVHPFFIEREIKNVLLVLVTSNRGLCGAYNAQVIKKALEALRTEHSGANLAIVTVGKKGDLAMRRLGQSVVASFLAMPDHLALRDVVPISDFLINEYLNEHFDRVLIAYTDFLSTLAQKPNLRQLLPVSKTSLKELIEGLENLSPRKLSEETTSINYLIEGEKEKLVGGLAEKLTRMQVYQMLLEANASEQSARMMAMKNASDASGEIIEDLTLVFNKARQANITREISEISAGMASVNSDA
jgi:F-type H+-transporting ATPase subunit gamma